MTRQTPRQHHSSEGIGVRPTAMPQRSERAPLHAERPRRGVFSRFLPFSAVFHCGHALRRPVPAAHARPACAIGRCRRHRLPVIVREIAAGVAPPPILRFVEPFSGRRSWLLANRHDRAQNH
ncbi:hypothetical protein DP49_5178 [Burkholderia pseudomallei]|nr:hypothetical protein DP49_5178 [Burkholderia pseudomallei]